MHKRCCYPELRYEFLQTILEKTIDSAWVLMMYNCHLLLLFMTTVINNYGLIIVSSNRCVRKACAFKRINGSHRKVNTGNRNHVDRNFSDHSDLGNRPL
jgi:hypothetical protein